VPQSPPNAAVAVTRPPPPGDGHQQGTVMQVECDSGRPKPPAETLIVPEFATSEGREAAAPRGRISWICRPAFETDCLTNSSAHAVSKTPKFHHITPILKSLH